MKVKYIIMLSCLAAAFTAASLWVFLSGGKNAKAVKAKFRLGGLMLTVSGMLSATSCDGLFPVMCYDTAVPIYVEFASTQMNEVEVGDVIDFTVKDLTCKAYTYEIYSQDNTLIQSGSFTLSGATGKITIGETEYRGLINLIIYGDDYYFGSRSFTLK